MKQNTKKLCRNHVCSLYADKYKTVYQPKLYIPTKADKYMFVVRKAVLLTHVDLLVPLHVCTHTYSESFVEIMVVVCMPTNTKLCKNQNYI